MYEIRQAGLKGLGVFATRPIVRGTRILAEKALLEVKKERDVFAAVHTLSSKDAAWMKSLSGFQRQQSPWARLKDVASYAFANYRAPGLGAMFRRHTITRSFDLLRVFRNNNFDVGRDTQALYRNMARVNHACAPNAQANFNGALDRFTLHTLRDIGAGEEVTINYLPETAAGRSSRRRGLEDGYGFRCACTICEEGTEESEKSETRRSDLHRRVSEAADQAESALENGEMRVERNLALTEAFIEVFTAERVTGRELASACMSAAENRAELGDLEGAAQYAAKGLDIDEACLGRDSPLFLQSVERMKAIDGSLSRG